MNQDRRSDGPYCGHPMKFYNLDRPRNDFAPFCHRPPHEGERHASAASVEHARQYRRDMKAARQRQRRLVLTYPPASVAAWHSR